MRRFVKVLCPIKFRDELTYLLPDGMELVPGEWVTVPVGKSTHTGLVIDISDATDDIRNGIGAVRLREIGNKVPLNPVSAMQLEFWKNLAEYYMCGMSDILRAACPAYLRKQAEVKRPRAAKCKPQKQEPLPELSPAQTKAREGIMAAFAEGRNALLHGVTGSGKTEIYMHVAADALQKGRTVLFLVPEIAMSQQLQERLERVFADKLLVFHSRQSPAQRKRVYDSLASGGEARIVLGTRSAIFLPAGNLGLVIVDEEHDASYKQEEPAPRYNGRDAAMLLASVCGAKVLLGSATPSLESLFNVSCGKLRRVDLTEKYFEGACEPEVIILDTIRARRNNDMQGSFSKHLLREIGKTVERGEQALIFRSRRAYSTMVQCGECGDVPSCPGCGVPLTYHKFKEVLECHYCGYHRRYVSACGKCGAPDALLPLGAGTERIEEELAECFPTYRIARFDADTAASKANAEKILKEFAGGRTDILVGTQMITKGFDFDRLTLVAIIAADSLLAVQDFRADERALQLLRQFRGRAGRRDRKGMMFIQTGQPHHPVFQRLVNGSQDEAGAVKDSLDERRNFKFPPFVRLVQITVRDRSEGELWHVSREIVEILGKCGVKDFDKVEGEQETRFWVKLARTSGAAPVKRELRIRLEALELRFKRKPQIIIDVDPI